MTTYLPRIADTILQKKLSYIGAVLIEGPKWCGKTTTAEQAAKSMVYLSDPQTLALADLDIKRLLDGASPRLLDEWQVAPRLWDAVRFSVDHRDGFGHFILTGSAVPGDTQEIFHTGTGRFSSLKMRPMSLFESNDSTGEVSLASLFSTPEAIEGMSAQSLADITYLICRGGWPKSIGMPKHAALERAYDYVDAVINSDISRVDHVSRKPGRVRALMRSYARFQGASVANTELKKDIATNDSETLNEDTVCSYINALKQIFVIEEMSAWNPNLRSKTVIRQGNTRYYIDPSIAAAALEVGPGDLEADLDTCGFLFETLCVRDLRIYADSLSGTVYHYHDKSELECDAVIHLRNGSYGLIEIKLGGDKGIADGVSSLKKLAEKIDTSRMKAPSFLMVLTGVGTYAYRRPDGVYVVPIGCLGP